MLKLFLFSSLIFTLSCENTVTLTNKDPRTGNVMSRTIQVNGQDTIFHGPSIILTPAGDTLVLSIYVQNKLTRQTVCDPKQGICKTYDYESRITTEQKK
ncbi:MAG: hypothetical protein HQK83_16475 [Fibrobacteria bacterium]|nr:hypothetical protein [Fibrobacteria bacterium]